MDKRTTIRVLQVLIELQITFSKTLIGQKIWPIKLIGQTNQLIGLHIFWPIKYHIQMHRSNQKIKSNWWVSQMMFTMVFQLNTPPKLQEISPKTRMGVTSRVLRWCFCSHKMRKNFSPSLGWYPWFFGKIWKNFVGDGF